LQGRRILVFAEQGFGDTLQFVRLLPALKALGATVLLEVQPALKRLLANAPGVDRIFARGDRLPPVDFQVPLMSLPHRLGLTLETIPAPVPYLAAEPEARAAWRQRLSNLKRPHVGLCWQGGREHKVDRWRSLPLERLTPLIAASDASFISLQKEDDRAEIAAAGLEGRLRSVAAELGDFADTAALIEDLDLVICVDTAVGHLAGALGKPVWLLLGFAPDFRWMRDRADNPWYPFHRLYRQERWGDWSVPLAGIGRALPGILAEFPGPTVPPAASTNLKK
jgi:ADP-heptose:LPS heptosyltransferase